MVAMAKVTTAFIEINKKFLTNLKYILAVLNQYRNRIILEQRFKNTFVWQTLSEYSNNTAATYCSCSIMPFLMMAK